jgi:hypothetical protein
MQAAYGDKCVDVSAVRCWVQELKQDEVQEPCVGRPVTGTDEQHHECVEEII